MKLFGSKSYVDVPPAPKMPPGLVELMEGLTKEVLKNNPAEIYEFCAEHMRKLIELRDHDTPKQCLTLEQKVSKANSIIRQRAEKRRQKYDNDLQILKQTENLTDAPEKINHDTDQLTMQSESPCNDSSKRHDEHLNNIDTKSEHIIREELSENINKVATAPQEEKNVDRNEQGNSDNQLNVDVDNSPINSMQYQGGDNNNKEDSIVAVDSNDKNNDKEKQEENMQGKFDLQDNLDFQSKDTNNDDVNDKELPEEKYTDKCEEKGNDVLSLTIDTDHEVVADKIKDSQIVDTNSQIDLIQKIASNDENGHKEKNEEADINGENNQREIEEKLVVNSYDQSEIKYEASINSEIMKEEVEQHSKADAGDQDSFNEEAAIIGSNSQKEIENESVLDDEGNQNATNKKAAIDDKINSKAIEEHPANNEEDQEKKIKDDVILNEQNNQKGVEEQLVTNKENESIEEDAVIKGENNREEIKGSLTNDEGEIKEESVTNHHKNEQKEPAKLENDGEDMGKVIDSNNEEKPNELTVQSSKNNQNGHTEMKEQGDTKLITEHKLDIEFEEGHNEESIKIYEAKSDESVINQVKIVFESLEHKSNDTPKDELNVVNGEGKKCIVEGGTDDTYSLISINKEAELVLKQACSETGTVSNCENLQIRAEPSQLDQPQAQDHDEVDIVDKPLIINIDLQQNKQDLVGPQNESEIQNIDDGRENDHVEDKEAGSLESKNSKPMDLETAAITIQKVFRNFLFRSKTSSFDDSTNIEFNIFDHDSDSKDIIYSNKSHILNKDKRPMGICRMDTVLQTVNEEKSLSLSTDDSSTLSSAATVIQAHIRGFLVRNRLNRNKTISSTSLADSDDPPASFETDPDPARNKTVLNIHIVPEGSNFLSRDESMLTSVELSLDGSPPASSKLHPLGYDKSERRKQLKREDAVQSMSPPSNNSTRLSEEHDSVKEVLFNDCKNDVKEAVDDELPVDSIITEDSDSDDVLSRETVEERQIENLNPATASDKKALSSDESDVITPFENGESKNDCGLDGNKLVHSGEFYDVVLPTKVSRNDTTVVRGE